MSRCFKHYEVKQLRDRGCVPQPVGKWKYGTVVAISCDARSAPLLRNSDVKIKDNRQRLIFYL